MAGETWDEPLACFWGMRSTGLFSSARTPNSDPDRYPGDEVERADSLTSVTGVRYLRAG